PNIRPHPSNPAGMKCHPVENLVFTKVAKCGGSTIANIFLRYGETHNFTFLLPKPGSALITKEDLYEHMDEEINMIVHHANFDERLMKRIMPEDTVYIGVMREPLHHLKSYYNYHNYGNIKTKPSLAEFEENPWKYRKEMGNLVNQQSGWYGWETKITMDDKMAWKFVEKIYKKFDFILITDHMKESLILLKDILCWTLDDMLFVSHKVATESAALKGMITTELDKSSLDHTPNKALAERNLRQFSKVDYDMFDFFNYTLWEKIRSKGDAFQQTLKEFDERLLDLQRTCKQTKESLTFTLKYCKMIIHESSSSPDYRCHRMLLAPNWYSQYILHPKQNKTNNH
ncbi:unnamed protein product, partial [Owenia fusiformis]